MDNIADIVFIGSGAAATTTLIELLSKLIESPGQVKLNITVVEKYKEFWTGIPYGSRSSVNSLTITAISDFISSGKERDLFFTWLQQNIAEWTTYYQQTGGLAAELWLAKNLPLIKQCDWSAVYLPRFVFGIYMQRKMQGLLQTAEEKQLVKFTLIQGEAIDTSLFEIGVYNVTVEYPDKSTSTISTKKVVIAMGSAPVKDNVIPDTGNGSYLYINELYHPSLDDNLKKLKAAFKNTSNPEDRNLLIIGSNASSIELLYLLNHRPDLLELANCIVTISQTGIMPYHISDVRFDDYPCENLDKVKETGGYDIHTLLSATKKDLIPAVSHGVIVPYVDRVISYTLGLMQVLDEDAKKIFFGVYGPQITRLIRRSGPAYKGSANALVEQNKLQLLKGAFTSIGQSEAGGVLNFTDADGNTHKYPYPFKVVINCSGSNDLVDSSSRLIRNLLAKNICQVNLSEKGFLVNENFEAAPNLYIMGPLLGGNMNKRIHFWHLENVARLLYLSPYLAEQFLAH